tara:strand:- start:3280 stop:4185 length:906 start_codon:yes stop_codon:yes gene_type:complete
MNIQDPKPLVSILINCYNSANYISRAINSVINQTYNNWELIIWDDGSTDNTVNIIKNFKDDRIRLFLQEKNLGLCKSRLNVIEKINGSLVSILDADDYFESEKISKQINVFKNKKEVALCTTWTKFYDENLSIKKIFKSDLNNNDLKKKLLFHNIIPHSSIMYKKEAAIEVGWYSKNYEYSQDYDLTLKLIQKNDIHLIKEHLTNIIQPKDNMSNSPYFKKIRIEENLKLLKNNLKFFEISSKDYDLLRNIIQANLIKLALSNLSEDKIYSIKEIIKIFFKNPLILFKFNLLKNLSEYKKI